MYKNSAVDVDAVSAPLFIKPQHFMVATGILQRGLGVTASNFFSNTFVSRVGVVLDAGCSCDVD